MTGYEKVERFFATNPTEVTLYCEYGRWKLFSYSTARALIRRGYEVETFKGYFIVHRKEGK